MTDKPLNVQVAEALGCKPVDVSLKGPPILQCHCRDGVHAVGGDGPDSRDVACYDLDWSATGPLISKHRINLDHDAPQVISAWKWNDRPVGDETGDELFDAHGETEPIAVCHLILKLSEAGKL